MSLSATLYSFNKRKNSTKQPVSGTSLSVTLNESGCSMLEPILIITGSSFTSLCSYNYAQFNGKYYFITNIVNRRNSVNEIHCTLDSLASYKSGIETYSGIVARCSDSNHYNDKLEDGMVTNTNVATTKVTTAGTDFTATGVTSIRVAGANSGGTNVDGFTQLYTNDIETALNKLMDVSSLGQISQAADDLLNSTWQPFKYIVSAKQIPLNLSVGAGGVTCQVGLAPNMINIPNATKIVDNASGNRYQVKNYSCSIPTPAYSDFRANSARFSMLNAFVPFIGNITIPTQYATWDNFNVQYRVDILTGATIARLTVSKTVGSTSKYANIGVYHLNIGADVQLIGSSENFGTNLLGSVPVIGKLLSGGSGTMFAPNYDTVGNVGSMIDGTDGMTAIHVYLTYFGSSDIPVTECGKPCMDTQTISNLASGYVQMFNPSIDTVDAPGPIIDEINGYLKGGFYYE